MKQLSILGSTGSIGVSTLEIVAAHPERFRIVALTAGFALALPYIVFEIWLFIAPGLHAPAPKLLQGLHSRPIRLSPPPVLALRRLPRKSLSLGDSFRVRRA